MSRYLKTFAAAVAWLVQLIEAINSDPVFQEVIADSTVTESEAVRLVLTLVIGVFGVYQLKNTPPSGEPADPTISEASR